MNGGKKMLITMFTPIFFHMITLAVIFAIPFIYLKLKVNAINAMPEQKSTVKIVNKTTRRSSAVSGGVLIRKKKCYVAFEFPCGDIKRFRVRPELYNSIFENEIGYITYKERNNNRILICFEKQFPAKTTH